MSTPPLPPIIVPLPWTIPFYAIIISLKSTVKHTYINVKIVVNPISCFIYVYWGPLWFPIHWTVLLYSIKRQPAKIVKKAIKAKNTLTLFLGHLSMHRVKNSLSKSDESVRHILHQSLPRHKPGLFNSVFTRYFLLNFLNHLFILNTTSCLTWLICWQNVCFGIVIPKYNTGFLRIRNISSMVHVVVTIRGMPRSPCKNDLKLLKN